MSTNHHTPIATGAPANASTFNSRFSDLDAAIDTVDDRVSTIIADSGTSSTEVVDSRGGYTVLSERVADLMHRTDVLLVDTAFNGLSSAKRFTTISAALAACTGGETILIAPGIYTGNLTVADNNVKLIGSGAPSYDSDTGRLVNGTIIRGRIHLGSAVGTVVRDLGVDLVGVDGLDCIGSNNTSDKLYRTFENLTLLGNGAGALAHGLYGAGGNLTIHNIRVYDCYHGIAIHGSYVNISDIHLYRCYGTALIIKAKSPNGDVEYVNVNNVVLEGIAASNQYSGAVHLQSEDSLEVRHVNIANVTAIYCVNGVLAVDRNDNTGAVKHVSITNVRSDNNRDLAVLGDFCFETGDNITLVNCHSTNRAGGFAFDTNDDGSLGNIYLSACGGDDSGSGLFSSSGDFAVIGVRTKPPLLQSISIANNTVITLTPPFSAGWLAVNQNKSDGGTGMALVFFRAAATPFCGVAVDNGSTNIEATTGALTGTTGTNGKTTISAHSDGLIYVENRRETLTYRFTWIG